MRKARRTINQETMGSCPSLSVTVVWYQPVLEETGESVTLQNKTFLSHISSVDVLSGPVDHHWRIVIIWIFSKSFYLSLWLAVGQKRPTEWYWSTDRGFWTHVFPTEDQKSWSSSGCVSHFLSQLECQEVGGGKVDDTVAAANGGHYSSWAGPNQLEPCGSPSLISNWLRAAKGSRVHRLSRPGEETLQEIIQETCLHRSLRKIGRLKTDTWECCLLFTDGDKQFHEGN